MKEVWKEVKGYEGLYEVSNTGKVKSLYGWNGKKHVCRQRIMRPTIVDMGYGYRRYVINLCKEGKKKHYSVHRLIAEAFLPNPNNYKVVNHIDCNPLNNCVENLEWCTQKHNIEHAIKMRRYKNFSYLTECQKMDICQMYKYGKTAKQIANHFNISVNVVKNVVFSYGINKEKYKNYKTKYGINIYELKKCFIKMEKVGIISKKFNCPRNLISVIKYQMKKRGEI